MTLSEFLEARIADDETWAHFAKRGNPPITSARVLAECEAKRGIVKRHTSCDDSSYGEPCEDLRDIALPYADHPDYQQKWKP